MGCSVLGAVLRWGGGRGCIELSGGWDQCFGKIDLRDGIREAEWGPGDILLGDLSKERIRNLENKV